MRPRQPLLALIPYALILLVPSTLWAQEAEQSQIKNWQDDPVCQAVFFGVLEGLYRDQVSLDVVNNIIGQQTPTNEEAALEARFKRSFVLDCPLCEPTFNAFLAYQSHLVNNPNFKIGGGSKLSAAVEKGLLEEEVNSRLMSLAPVIQRWMETKFKSSDLSESAMNQWRNRIHSRANEGTTQLSKLKRSSKHYEGWSAYFGCAACRGSEHAAMRLDSDQKANK